jgi:hypothetical protein
MNISLIAVLLKRLVAACLTCVILWHVAHRAGPHRGKAIVHVTQPDVIVKVDGQRYHVGSIAESPLACELEPGRHEVELWERGVLTDEESFTIEAGRDVILCPGARATGVRSTGDRPAGTTKVIVPHGLAVRAQRPNAGDARN